MNNVDELYNKITTKVPPGFFLPRHIRDEESLTVLWDSIKDVDDVTVISVVVTDFMIGKAKRWVVSAAIRICNFFDSNTDFVLPTPRHFTDHTHIFINNMKLMSPEFNERYTKARKEGMVENGFIDQWGNYLTREEAMLCVKFTGQPYQIDRGGKTTQLFSEDIYGWQTFSYGDYGDDHR